MTRRRKLVTTTAAIALAGVALAGMFVRHRGAQASTSSPLTASALADTASVQAIGDVTSAIKGSGLDIQRLNVRMVDGIVILHGRVSDPSAIERAGATAKALGYARVANMIQLVPASNDDAIERAAERQIARTRSLDGCHLAVSSQQGILTISGTVRSELQKDAARGALASIEGVREIRSEIRSF